MSPRQLRVEVIQRRVIDSIVTTTSIVASPSMTDFFLEESYDHSTRQIIIHWKEKQNCNFIS